MNSVPGRRTVRFLPLDEAYGKGAWLNGRPISVATTATLPGALIGCGVPSVSMDLRRETLHVMSALAPHCFNLRMIGCAAISLAYVACGRLAGVFESGLHVWDIAAGAVIVREAGGMLSNFSGRAYALQDREIVATNGRIHDELIRYTALRHAGPAAIHRTPGADCRVP